MRYTRLFIGLVVIIFALWIIIGEQMTGASANATVNAQLSTLRAPVAGVVTMPVRPLGTSVRRGEELASLRDPLVDGVRRDDLMAEVGFAEAVIVRHEAEINSLNEEIAGLEARLAQYTAARLEEIETRLVHARARLTLLEESRTAPAIEDDLTELLDEGQSGAQPDAQVSGVAYEYALERVAVLEIALAAARDGVFVGDSYNDAPYSEQRRNELARQRAGLEADLAEAVSRRDVLNARLDEERLRANRFGGGALASTVNGQIWEVLASQGEVVQRGQDVMRLLDCDSAVVTLSVTESIYNRLTLGDAAQFRMSADGRSFDGTVTRLGGAGALTLYQNLAIAPSQRHLERYDVMLLVPALRDEPDLRCSVGQTGRVFFEDRPLDWLRGLTG